MSAEPRTPLRASKNVPHRGSPLRPSTNAFLESLPSGSSYFKRSPTLVGDSPPPFTQSTTLASASQKSTSYDDTSICLASTGSSASSRKSPTCRRCGAPMKGHRRGICSVPTSNESKSLYESSPENERIRPSRTPNKPEHVMTEKGTASVSATTSSSASASGKRKQPHCSECGLPMKGHKRPLGALQCPTDTWESPSWENDTSLTSTPPSRRKSANVSWSKLLPPFKTSTNGETPINSERSGDRVVVKGRHRRSITPTPNFALSEQPWSTKNWINSRQKSPDPPRTPFSTVSSCSSISAYIPIPFSQSVPQSSEVESTFDDLRQDLGEPELVIYPACNRDEAALIRTKAKELHYFSGVVNIKMQGCDGKRNSGRLENKAKYSKVAGLSEESHFYVKWVILSKEEEMVRRCVDLYGKRTIAT
ncbi:hypothetical protein AX15_000600 [Amanita polypyramis BW_CC]|nr:hypothetical protein AX15_000600 [Amanita polypyramis BW_CC]